MECGVSESIGLSRARGGGGSTSDSVVQRRQQPPPPPPPKFFVRRDVARQVSADVHSGDFIDGSAGGACATSDVPTTSNQLLPSSGTVTQVCRKWGVYEDEVYAYKLQEKEIEMHYGKNRENRHLVRSDLKQAKDLQMVESTEAHTHERAAQTLEFQDEILARRLQHELEGEVSAKIKSLEIADKEMAEYLQRLECRRESPVDQGGFDKRLHKPHKTRPLMSSPSSSLMHKSSTRHEYKPISDESVHNTRSQAVGENLDHPRPPRMESVQMSPRRMAAQLSLVPAIGEMSPRAQFSSVSDGSTLEVVDDDEETLRLMQEEEDARLARLLQEEESLKKSQDYRDQQLAIEAQDRELAKLLQEQERAKARRARHKYHKPRSTDALQAGEQSEHLTQKDEDKRSPAARGKAYPPVRETLSYSDHQDQACSSSSSKSMDAARPVRPTKLPVVSSYPHEPRLEPAPRRRDTHLSRSPLQSDNGNVATVIDPTYRRSHSKQGHLQDAASSASPILPTPMTMQSAGSVEGFYPLDDDDEYDRLDEDHVPPYMPIQGQKRIPSMEKQRKKKDNCKQQ